MSPNVGNFVHDLAEMAKATERLPQLQAELDYSNAQVEAYAKQVQRLEMRLMDASNELTEAHRATHKAEEDRDEATRAFLEADDRTEKALRLVKGFMGEAGSFLQALEPPKPEPIAELKVEASEDESPLPASATAGPASAETASHTGHAGVGSEPIAISTEVSVPSDPTPATESSFGSGSSDWTDKYKQHEQAQEVPASDPTAPSWAGPTPSLASAPTDAADTVADAFESANARYAPYLGKKWSEVTPRVYNYGDWERGGGTAENFNL